MRIVIYMLNHIYVVLYYEIMIADTLLYAILKLAFRQTTTQAAWHYHCNTDKLCSG